MNKKRKALIAANEISEMKSYILNGRMQKVLIEGKKASNPLVIFLHGGPGSPVPFNAGCRGMFPELTDRLTMVYWDQLGCGINNCPVEESLLSDHYAAMTIDLIKQLRADFGERPVNLFAVSWGSILAAKAAKAVPELIGRVVVYGQVLRPLFSHDEVFEVLGKSNMPDKYKARLALLQERGGDYRIEELITVLKWMHKYTEGYQSKKDGGMGLGSLFAGFLTSPDYSLKDVGAVLVNGYRKNRSLFNEMLSIELSDTLEDILVPYTMIQGDKDIVTSTKIITEFVEASKNPNLYLQRFAGSGHIPGAKAMDEVMRTVFSLFGEDY